ncbi:MAG: CoA-binding protein [Dehalococcoidia bacterium]|nr:CoA-binding protein [Dehalococcoidia bacterium]
MEGNLTRLDRVFNPRCIAVVGDKSESNFMWLRAQSTFKGRLYSVQVDPKEIARIQELGVENYTSLLDIRDAVDLAIVAVPRAVAPQILEDCIQKGVAAAHFFTAGFAETDTKEGRQLESSLTQRAREADFCLIGPNCMGIFNPALGVRQSEGQYTGIAGPTGLISQSGTHAITFSIEGHLQGVDISKSVSFGNGVVLDAADYLDYFGHDAETSAIGMYLEGVRDGNRFLAVLRAVSAQKPVVIWKGGQTEEGGRAIAAHTGSLALPRAIWTAAVRQCGAIRVANLEELVDTLKALIYLPPVLGDRVALAGGSGGQSVAIADAFADAGLKVPHLTQESYHKLATFFSPVGASCRNPIDPGANRREMRRIMEILERDAHIDNLVLVIWPAAWRHFPELFEREMLAVVGLREKTSKPVMAILPTFSSPESLQQMGTIAQQLHEGGIPTFPTVERGARALRNALEYYRSKGKLNAN